MTHYYLTPIEDLRKSLFPPPSILAVILIKEDKIVILEKSNCKVLGYH